MASQQEIYNELIIEIEITCQLLSSFIDKDQDGKHFLNLNIPETATDELEERIEMARMQLNSLQIALDHYQEIECARMMKRREEALELHRMEWARKHPNYDYAAAARERAERGETSEDEDVID